MLLRPRIVFQIEGLTVLVISVALYARSGQNWLLFAGLFFVPDLALLGYMASNTFGTAVYNLVHTYVLPASLATAAVAFFDAHSLALAAAYIWAAHIGFDRMLGMTLRTPPEVYGHAHLRRIGRAAAPRGS